jgi:hypothetical protein
MYTFTDRIQNGVKMDIRKRKLRGIFVLSVLIILCLCVASVISYFVPQKSADALISASPVVSIGELLIDGYETVTNTDSKHIFNKDKLTELYKAINPSGADINSIKGLGTKTSADFRANNAEKI